MRTDFEAAESQQMDADRTETRDGLTFSRNGRKVITLSVEGDLLWCTRDLDVYEHSPLSFLFSRSNPLDRFNTSDILTIARLSRSGTDSECGIDVCDSGSGHRGCHEGNR